MSQEPIDFAERRRRLQAERDAAGIASTMAPPVVAQPPPTPQPPPPGGYGWEGGDLGNDGRESDDQLDGILAGISVADAYNKFIRKMHAIPAKRDGNMIACPLPDHADPPPRYNAWFSTDGTWFCGKCQEGGDVFDLAAIGLGFPRPGYKDGQLFHKLREQMAEAFGWHIKRVTGGDILYQDEPAANPEPASAGPDTLADAPTEVKTAEIPETPDEVADTGVYEAQDNADNIVHMFGTQPDEFVAYPSINWREIVPPDTFLAEYLKACCKDDSPEEYHFWNGLLALGSAVGRKVTLEDSRPVLPNLMVCILGSTGSGKSRSFGWLKEVVRAALPYQEDGTAATGTKLVPTPGSGEFLIKSFTYEMRDPTNNKLMTGYAPVNGIVDFDELSNLLSRSNRSGSAMTPTIMQFADGSPEVTAGSLTRGEYKASMPFCSIMASTQPKAIRDLLGRESAANGFLNRWVFAGGVPKQTEVLGGVRSNRIIDLTEAIRLLKEVHGWGGFARSVAFEDDAYYLYESYMRKVVLPTRDKDDTDLLKRLDLLYKKVLLLFTINRKALTVDEATVRAAVPIIEYVIRCFNILDHSIGRTVMDEAYDDIMAKIKQVVTKTGRPASARDIWDPMRRKYSLDQIKRAVETMVALDLIELAQNPPGMKGRPTARYQITAY